MEHKREDNDVEEQMLHEIATTEINSRKR